MKKQVGCILLMMCRCKTVSELLHNLQILNPGFQKFQPLKLRENKNVSIHFCPFPRRVFARCDPNVSQWPLKHLYSEKLGT